MKLKDQYSFLLGWKKVFLFLIFLCNCVFSQEIVTGKITDENNIMLSSVLVVNISTNKSSYSDISGQFVIDAQENDEVRFVKKGYYRSDTKITKDNIKTLVNISLLRIETLIPEVKIPHKLTGNLANDSKLFDRPKKEVALQSDMNKYMKSALNRPLPLSSSVIPSSFRGHDFNAGQIDAVKLLEGVVDLVGKATGSKATTPNYIENQNFINRIKLEVNLNFLAKYGMNIENVDRFLVYANDKLQLAKKYRKDFDEELIESELKRIFKEYIKTNKILD